MNNAFFIFTADNTIYRGTMTIDGGNTVITDLNSTDTIPNNSIKNTVQLTPMEQGWFNKGWG